MKTKHLIFIMLFSITSYSQNYMSRPYQVQEPVQRGNIDFDYKILNTLQSRYDRNYQKIINTHNSILEKIHTVAKVKNANTELYQLAVAYYNKKYYSELMSRNYDLSSDTICNSIIQNLQYGCNETLCIAFDFCE